MKRELMPDAFRPPPGERQESLRTPCQQCCSRKIHGRDQMSYYLRIKGPENKQTC